MVEEELNEPISLCLKMTNSEYTKDDLLRDFKNRCIDVINRGGDLNFVRDMVIKRECPFIDMQYEKDEQFRMERRFYRRNDMIDDLLKIIQEVQNE